MNTKFLYRAVAILLLLMCLGHTLGFAKTQPEWNADAMVNLMQGVHFQVGPFTRSYWEFYLGMGYLGTVFQLFSALLAWSLSGLSRETLDAMPLATWAFALSFVGMTCLSLRYFFLPPLIFSIVIALLLITAAVRAQK